MRRVGPKGSGEFTRISWDEALETIAARLRRRDRDARRRGDLALPRQRQHGPDPGRLRRRAPAVERARHVAPRADDLHDRGRIRHRLHAGRQPRRNGPGDAPVLEARSCSGARTCCRRIPTCGGRSSRRARNGALVVAIDPIRTRTAAASDWHLAPMPGTDAALALGLLHVVLAEGREDREFIDRAHRRLGGVSPAHPRVSAVARRRDHRASGRVDRRAGQAAGRDPADRHSHRHRHPASRRRRHGGADDHLHSRRHRRLALSGRRRLLRHARLLRPELGRAVARRPAGRGRARALQHDATRRRAARDRRSAGQGAVRVRQQSGGERSASDEGPSRPGARRSVHRRRRALPDRHRALRGHRAAGDDADRAPAIC